MNAKRVLAGLVAAALLVGTAAPALADEAVLQPDGDIVVTDEAYVEQDGSYAEQAEAYVEQDPAELLTTEPETVIINDEVLSGENAEEYEPEELIIVDESVPETALEETETATEAETESAAEERFAVLLPKTEGGEVIFAESETLPPAEENEDESIRERRSFAEGEKVEIMVRAVSEEYRLAGIKVVSAEDADREYPLETTEQGYAFLMPAEAVKVLAAFEINQMPESEADAVAAPEEEAVSEQSATDVPEAVTEQSAADALEAEVVTEQAVVDAQEAAAVTELPAVEEQKKAGSSLPAGADENKKKDTTDKKTKSSDQSVQENKKAEKKEKAEEVEEVEEAEASDGLLGAAVKSVKLNKSSLTITKGKTATLKATVSPSNASNKGVTWKSSNKSVATVSSKGVVTAKKAGTATITVTTKSGNKKATCKVTVKNPSSAATQKKPSVSYRTHVQTIGWKQGWKKDGAMAGTQGQSKRLEGINIKLSNLPYSGGVQYRTHVQTKGWEKSWRSNGAMSGTQGQAKRLEAIQIKLTGEMAKKYDIYYRVHAQHFGWMGWAKNGERSGTAGYAYRLEGIQIVLVKKGAGAPSANYGGQRQWTSTKFSEKKASKYGIWDDFIRNKRYTYSVYGGSLSQYGGAFVPKRYAIKDVTGDSKPELFLEERVYSMVNGTPKLLANTLPDYVRPVSFCGYSSFYRSVVYYAFGMDYKLAQFITLDNSGKELNNFEIGVEYNAYSRDYYIKNASGRYVSNEPAVNFYLDKIENISNSEWKSL